MTDRIRCWSKSNSACKIYCVIKKLDDNGNATDAGADQNFTDFRKNQRNETNILTSECNRKNRDREIWRSSSLTNK